MRDLTKLLNQLGYLDYTPDALFSSKYDEAVLAFQSENIVELDRLCWEIHHRPAVIDGVVGPATEAVADLPRCGWIQPKTFSTGSGSWPVGCHSDWRRNHAINIAINFGRRPAFLQPIFEQVWELVKASYADMGIMLLRADQGQTGSIQIDFMWENLRGNIIGLAIVPRGPRCNSRIWCKYSPGYRPRDLVNQWARLIAHELGHNMGMGHTRGGIMNPSILGGVYTRTAWRGDPAEATMRRYFGGVPIDITPPQPPTPEKTFGFALIQTSDGLLLGGEGQDAELKVGSSNYKGKVSEYSNS